jgi:hypothetical protein
MALEVALPFFAALIAFGTVNLLLATALIRRRAPAAGGQMTPQAILSVLALGLIAVVLMAALIIDILLIQPSIPAVGRPLAYVVGALITRLMRQLFGLLPNTPALMPRLLTGLERVLFALAVVVAVLSLLLRGA